MRNLVSGTAKSARTTDALFELLDNDDVRSVDLEKRIDN
jgi:hypothetical protein